MNKGAAEGGRTAAHDSVEMLVVANDAQLQPRQHEHRVGVPQRLLRRGASLSSWSLVALGDTASASLVAGNTSCAARLLDE